MKWYISFLLIFNFFFFIGCSSSSVNVNSKRISNRKECVHIIKKEKKNIRSSNYSLVIKYRRQLKLIGINYLPWRSNSRIDPKLMKTLLHFNKKEVKRFHLDSYKMVATRANSFVSKNNIFYLNYKNSLDSIRKIAQKKLVNSNYITRKQYTKRIKKIYKKPNKINIDFKSKGIRNEFILRNELGKLYPSEISRYHLDKYEIIPISKGDINKEGNKLYIPVNTLYQEILIYCQKTKL